MPAILPNDTQEIFRITGHELFPNLGVGDESSDFPKYCQMHLRFARWAEKEESKPDGFVFLRTERDSLRDLCREAQTLVQTGDMSMGNSDPVSESCRHNLFPFHHLLIGVFGCD